MGACGRVCGQRGGGQVSGHYRLTGKSRASSGTGSIMLDSIMTLDIIRPLKFLDREEEMRRANGIYTLADQSAGAVQRRYFADSVSSVLDGFAESEYPDWRTLFRAVARQAGHAGWRGPLVID